MKTSKGFGTILVIVIGLLVLGGGGYYLSQKLEPTEDENVTDILSPEIEEDIQEDLDIEKEKDFTVTIGSNLEKTFNTGDTIEISWQGCSEDIGVTLSGYVENSPHKTGSYPATSGLNSNSYTYVIPENVPSAEYHFWVYSEKCNIGAYSDKSFSIISSNIDEKEIGYIKDIYVEEDDYYLDIDYIIWVTAGNEHSVDLCPNKELTPNGYCIVNNNDLIRTFPVSDDVIVKMQTYSHADDGNFNYNQVVSLEKFIGIYEGEIIPVQTMKDLAEFGGVYNNYFDDALYWVTIKNGVVVEIQQQYRP